MLFGSIWIWGFRENDKTLTRGQKTFVSRNCKTSPQLTVIISGSTKNSALRFTAWEWLYLIGKFREILRRWQQRSGIPSVFRIFKLASAEAVCLYRSHRNGDKHNKKHNDDDDGDNNNNNNWCQITTISPNVGHIRNPPPEFEKSGIWPWRFRQLRHNLTFTFREHRKSDPQAWEEWNIRKNIGLWKHQKSDHMASESCEIEHSDPPVSKLSKI